MKTTRSFLTGMGIGMACMYMLDPRLGRRRRAVMRDKMIHSARLSQCALDTALRDLSHRMRGVVCEARNLVRRDQISDQVLEARIRSRIGRVVSHPHAIQVSCEDGRCMVSGPILRHEVDDLISCVESVRGVKECIDHLEVHDSRGTFPALQGGVRRDGLRFELMQSNWAPGTRLTMGILGGAMAAAGIGRRGIAGPLMTTMGLALVTRCVTNMEFSRLFGIGGGRRGICIQKSIEIHAPVEQVYGFWTRFENFPRFMSHLKEVRDLGNGRSRWVAMGPAGIPFQWEAVITRDEPNELLCWKSAEGSVIESAGRIRFERCDDNCTRIHIQMTYNPPAGAIGHAIARLFAVDPKHCLDEDLIRLKSLFENGKTHVNSHIVTARELGIRDSQAVGAM